MKSNLEADSILKTKKINKAKALQLLFIETHY